MEILNYPSDTAQKRIDTIINRGIEFDEKAVVNVRNILDDVKKTVILHLSAM